MHIFPYPESMTTPLPWPFETATPAADDQLRWSHPGSNICLDFHGDPVTARLVVFSDGNHHMALEASLQAFRARHPDVNDIFYATTPPGVLVNYLKAGHLSLGNLTLSRLPDVFISPPNILETLQQAGFVKDHRGFMASRGNVLLINKGNPKDIHGIADLLRDDVTLFMSNPKTEKASYDVYSETVRLMAAESALDQNAIDTKLTDPARTCFGELIHHREAPQCLHDGKADVAVIYYHLALRYTRIFPELFEFIPLEDGTSNITTTYHIALVNHTSTMAQQLLEFMFDDAVTQIYVEHGLIRPQNE